MIGYANNLLRQIAAAQSSAPDPNVSPGLLKPLRTLPEALRQLIATAEKLPPGPTRTQRLAYLRGWLAQETRGETRARP